MTEIFSFFIIQNSLNHLFMLSTVGAAKFHFHTLRVLTGLENLTDIRQMNRRKACAFLNTSFM